MIIQNITFSSFLLDWRNKNEKKEFKQNSSCGVRVPRMIVLCESKTLTVQKIEWHFFSSIRLESVCVCVRASFGYFVLWSNIFYFQLAPCLILGFLFYVQSSSCDFITERRRQIQRTERRERKRKKKSKQIKSIKIKPQNKMMSECLLNEKSVVAIE